MGFIDLIDRELTEKRAKYRLDSACRMCGDVLAAHDPEAEFERYARVVINGAQDNRRLAISLLMQAFGITDRPAFKRLLRSKSICGEAD